MPLLLIPIIFMMIAIIKSINEKKYKELESKVLNKLGFNTWDIIPSFDEIVVVKSRQALENYDEIKFFKENKEKLESAKNIIKRKNEIKSILNSFLINNEYSGCSQYNKILNQINMLIGRVSAYRICVKYISYAGNHLDTKGIYLNQRDIEKFEKDPTLLMGKGEYNKYLKEQEKEALNQNNISFMSM